MEPGMSIPGRMYPGPGKWNPCAYTMRWDTAEQFSIVQAVFFRRIKFLRDFLCGQSNFGARLPILG
jgi:hypothetical protein